MFKVHCSLYACLPKVCRKNSITNQTFRNRFGLDSKKNSVASRIIKDAINSNLIQSLEPDISPKHMKYVPFWT